MSIFFLVMANLLLVGGQKTVADHIVAVVDGEEIEYTEIDLSQEEAIFRYKILHGSEPRTESEIRELEKLRKQLEKTQLAARIHAIIARRQRDRLGVEVTEVEILGRWKQLTRGVDPGAAVERQRRMIAPLVAALKAVYEKGESEDAVYERLLRNSMTREEWEIQVHYYRKPDRRKILEDTLKHTPEDLRRPDEGFRKMLVHEKMNEAIDREIAKRDQEFADYKTLLKRDPGSERLQGFGPNYLAVKRWLWWQERYKEAKIVIRDEEFEDVTRMLMSSDPTVNVN